MTKITKQFIEHCKKLKWLAEFSSGATNLSFDDWRKINE